jgi:hypothetical protein
MLLLAQDRTRFPKLHHFLSTTAPLLATTDVVTEMAELTGLRADLIRGALRPGSPPKVLVTANLACGSGPAKGCFRPAKPEQIEVRQEEVVRDESGDSASWENRRIGRLELRESHVTLLHELVHWADFKANGRSTRTPAPYHDIGSQWEWMVFGIFDEDMVHRSP